MKFGLRKFIYRQEVVEKSNIEVIRELYNRCKDMDIEDTIELELEAVDEDERNFISVISDFILQQKQRKVIEQKRF